MLKDDLDEIKTLIKENKEENFESLLEDILEIIERSNQNE